MTEHRTPLPVSDAVPLVILQDGCPPLPPGFPAPFHIELRPGEAWLWCDRTGDRCAALAKALVAHLAETGAPGYGTSALISFECMAQAIEEELANDDSDFVEGGIAQGHSVRAWLEEAAGAPLESVDSATRLILAACALDDFLDRGIKFLSTGELRRALLARSLLAEPRLLVLDKLFDAIDQDSRTALRASLESWLRTHGERETPTGGPRAIAISIERSPDAAPSSFDRLLLLEGNAVAHCGPRVKGSISGRSAAKRASGSPRIDTGALRALAAEARRQEGLDEDSIFKRDSGASKQLETLVELSSVNVGWGGRHVLEDLSWSVLEGEHWLITGPNGSGKTSLLGLVNGDNPQAYANEVRLFGRKRGSGETVWDIKRELGTVSWALHRDYRNLGDTRLDEVLASGLFDSIGLYRPIGDGVRGLARHWLAFAGYSGREGQRFGELDWGEQREILILRAIIKLPRLLILDEPCQGLDAASRERVLALLAELLSLGLTTILHVTHDSDERIAGIRCSLALLPGQHPMYRAIRL